LAAAKASSDLVRVSLLSTLWSVETAITSEGEVVLRVSAGEERGIPRVSLAPVIAETAIREECEVDEIRYATSEIRLFSD